jgi:cytochrome c oxidase subunit IV
MNDRNLLRGLFLMAFALVFGLGSLSYSIGEFSHAGPGLFPLLVSCLLFLIGLLTAVRSRFVERVPLTFNLKNIGLILLSLGGFAVISEHLNMIAGIAFMVFCASAAGSSYSVVRNLKVTAGLIAFAVALQQLLRLDLRLY